MNNGLLELHLFIQLNGIFKQGFTVFTDISAHANFL